MFTGITYNDRIRVLLIAALIFAIVNALIRPIVIILSLPAIVLTLGLFTLVVNAFMLYLTSFFYHSFHVTSLWSAIGAVLIVWLVNYLMTDLIRDREVEPK